MASTQMERLRSAIGKRTTKIKDLLDDDAGKSDLALAYEVAAEVSEILADANTVIEDLQRDALDNAERSRDRFEDDYDRIAGRRDDRDRDRRDRDYGRPHGRWGNSNERGRGGRY